MAKGYRSLSEFVSTKLNKRIHIFIVKSLSNRKTNGIFILETTLLDGYIMAVEIHC